MTSSRTPSSRSFALSENNGSPSRSDANSDIVFSGSALGAVAPGAGVFVGAGCRGAGAEPGAPSDVQPSALTSSSVDKVRIDRFINLLVTVYSS